VLKLTRLKLSGFKSFYSKTEIEFPGGITAVVGPNGCGKSNISDAISWVLGEQSSKSLRGSKMEDVIFNGTARRGPLPMAEVVLTLTWSNKNGANGNGHAAETGDLPVESETFHPRPEVFAAVRAVADEDEAAAASPESAGGEPVAAGSPVDADGREMAAGEDLPQGNGHEPAPAATGDGAADTGDVAEAAEEKAAPPAYVLPTEDGEEISITRRLFRSGESEYRINDRRVRLKDVQSMMQAARIGTRTYAVIEQDRISALLSARPKERKAMIEEAAGILGIKGRRRSAMLKLDHTEANLSRLRDLVAEVTRQVNSLKRQAAKARRYRRNAEEMRHQRRLLFALDHESLERILRELEEDLQRLKSAESNAAADSSRRDAVVAGLRQRIDEDGEEAGGRRDELHAAEREVERLDGDRRALAERIREAREMTERCARQARDLRQRAEEARTGAGQRETEREATAAQVDELQVQVTALEEAYTARLAQADDAARHAEEDRGQLLSAVGRLGEARNRAHKFEERGHRLGKQRQRLEREMEACRLELAEDEERLSATVLELAAGDRAVVQAEELCSRHQEESVAATSRSQEARDHLAGTRRQLESCRERATALAALWHGVREDETQAEAGSSLGEGVEADGPWEEAAGAWSESVLQARLVPDVATALAMVRQAHEQQDGRVRLAVRDLIPAPSGRPDRLSGVLKGKADHAAYLAAALQDPVLVDDLETAVENWRRQPGQPYLTREGEGITAAGLIVAGPRGEGARLLACNRQRREAIEEATGLEDRLPALEEAVAAAAAELEQATARAEESRSHQENVRHDLVEQKTLHERFKEAADRQVRRRDVLQEEETVLLSEEEEHRREMTRATEEAEAAEGERRRAEAVVAASQEALDRMREEIHGLAGERTEQRAVVAARKEALAALTLAVARLLQEATDHEQRADADEEESRSRAGVAAGLEAETASLGVQREELMDRVVVLRERSRADELSLQESRAALDTAEGEARRAGATLEEAREGTRERELERARGQADREHREKECREEFDCSPAELATGLTDEDRLVTADTARAELERLEGIRDRIGPVNMVAIDQFTEEEERQTYLMAQQEDLEKSIRSLLATIQKIDRTSRERFQVALDAIRIDFARIFKELFGGGVADIELQEPDDILESGIDIIAQPPGKRTRNINLLSGGEKALSAIALLFAIFKFRPAPFCLLDEADAALDEANVERFTRLLESYGGETQFILITHNRRSMEVADVMYGVTMEEPGISQTVSLGMS
jgi:chromosome segregation protein